MARSMPINTPAWPRSLERALYLPEIGSLPLFSGPPRSEDLDGAASDADGDAPSLGQPESMDEMDLLIESSAWDNTDVSDSPAAPLPESEAMNGAAVNGTHLAAPLLLSEEQWARTMSEARIRLLDDGEDLHSKAAKTPSTSSTWQIVLNGMNILCGMGLLAVPYATAQAGYGCLAAMALLCACCIYTGWLMHLCITTYPHINSYPALAQQYFGIPGRLAVAVIMYLELYSACVETVVLVGDDLRRYLGPLMLPLLKNPLPVQVNYILPGLVVTPMAVLRDLSWLSYTSSVGLACSMAIMILVFSFGVTNTGFNQLPSVPAVRPRNLPLALGLFSFCFSGHSVLPNLRSSMRHPASFPRALVLTFVSITIFYVLSAVLGVSMFGKDVAQQITLSLSNTSQLSRVSVSANVLVMLNPLTSYALFMHPVASGLEELLPQGTSPFVDGLGSLAIRLALVVSTVVVATTFPFFAELGALVGSMFSVTLALVWPCLCYLKHCNWRPGALTWTLCIFCMLYGFMIAVSGTISTATHL